MRSEGNTVRLHRVITASPEKVYRAFVDPDAKARWLPPHGFTGKVHHQDVRVGGRLQDVVHKLHDRTVPFLERKVP